MTARLHTPTFFAAILFALTLLLPLSTAAQAAKTPKVKAPAYHGVVMAVSDSSITIQEGGKNGSPKTFTVTPDTKVKIDKTVAKMSDIVVGYHANIRSFDGTTAVVIAAHPKKVKAK